MQLPSPWHWSPSSKPWPGSPQPDPHHMNVNGASSSLWSKRSLCVHAQLLSCVWLFATAYTVACQVPLSMGILQARILEWVAMPFFRRSPLSRWLFLFKPTPPCPPSWGQGPPPSSVVGWLSSGTLEPNAPGMEWIRQLPCTGSVTRVTACLPSRVLVCGVGVTPCPGPVWMLEQVSSCVSRQRDLAPQGPALSLDTNLYEPTLQGWKGFLPFPSTAAAEQEAWLGQKSRGFLPGRETMVNLGNNWSDWRTRDDKFVPRCLLFFETFIFLEDFYMWTISKAFNLL